MSQRTPRTERDEAAFTVAELMAPAAIVPLVSTTPSTARGGALRRRAPRTCATLGTRGSWAPERLKR
jgi:hypothetical protein